jgi:DNA-binding transcriptional LysR family regulator
MEMRQLRYFVAVAEELHFGRAAERVHICQPPLSQQIKNLEEELGARLLHRSSRNVSLTDAGKAFLEDAHDILSRTEEAARRVQRMVQGQEGRLIVGFVLPALDTMFPDAIREFRSDYPLVELVLREMGTPSQLEALQASQLDIGLIRLFRQNTDGIVFQRIVQEPYVLAMSVDHHLASNKQVPIRLLGGEPLILFPRQTHPALHDRIVSALTSASGTPLIVQEVTTKATAIALAAAGIGLALVPESSKKQKRKGIVFRRIVGPLPKVELSLAWKQDNDKPCLHNFIDRIRKVTA